MCGKSKGPPLAGSPFTKKLYITNYITYFAYFALRRDPSQGECREEIPGRSSASQTRPSVVHTKKKNKIKKKKKPPYLLGRLASKQTVKRDLQSLTAIIIRERKEVSLICSLNGFRCQGEPGGGCSASISF